MTTGELKEAGRHEVHEGSSIGTAEHQIVVSGVLRQDLKNGRFNHRSRVPAAPEVSEEVFSD